MAAKAWFKLVNSDSKWSKISLEGIKDVDDIKKAIKREMSQRLNSYDAADLTIAATKGDEDASLAVVLNEREDIASILRRFAVEGIPSIEAAFGREICLFAHIPSALERPAKEGHRDSSKRSRSGGSEGSEPRTKRSKQSMDSLSKNRELFELIKANSPDPATFADPTQKLHPPFPFLWHKLPTDRFEISEGRFSYVGREGFEDLWGQVSKMRENRHETELFLCGTVGYGKSHLLACLVCMLITGGEAVVYLPDCRAMLGGIVPYLKAAMFLTFAGDVKTQEEVAQLSSPEEIVDFFTMHCPREGIFFIIDQWNAVEPDEVIGRDDWSNEEKSYLRRFLRNIASPHRLIRSASANFLTIRHMEQKQTNDIKVFVHGGLSKTEMAAWWKINKNIVPGDHTREEIEDLTGRVPLLLQSVFRNGGTADLAAPELEKVSNQVQLFVSKKFNDLEKSPGRWRWYVDYMNDCILNREVSVIEPDLCDHRYFYHTRGADGRMRGFSICGVARNSLAKILRRYRSIKASEHSLWLWNLRSVINNPSVTGFLVENACLSCIALNGLQIGLNLEGGMVEKAFSGRRPEYSWEDKRVIYCPTSFNFPAIDALIVLIESLKDRKKVFLFPVQVTIAKEQKNSEPQFFANWAEWFRDLEDVEHEIHFLWITHDERHLSKAVHEDSLEGRDGEKIIHPSYTSHRVPISLVSTHISERLRAARREAPTEVAAGVDKWPGGYTVVGNSGSGSTRKSAREKKTRPPSKTDTMAGPEGQSGGPSVASGIAASNKRNAPVGLAAKGKAPAKRK